MANREPFPYGEDWRKDLPFLFKHGIIQVMAKKILENDLDTQGVSEGLHARVIRSSWDFIDDGQPFINVNYKYPSVIWGENVTGSMSIRDENWPIQDEDTLVELDGLADQRTVEVWKPSSGEFIPAMPT